MATAVSKIVESPSAAPVAQQLVVAQCAVNPRVDADHQACVAPHTPLFYDRIGLHSKGVNQDVLEASACGSVVNGTRIPFRCNLNDKEDRVYQRVVQTNARNRGGNHFVGIAQSPVLDGAGVRAHPEAMGRLGVAIGGLVPLAVSGSLLKDAKIGDYIRLDIKKGRMEALNKLTGVSSDETYSFSGAPAGLKGVLMSTYSPDANGRPKRQLDNKVYAADDSKSVPNTYIDGTTIGRIFQFGPGTNEVQVLVV